ncbi:hypothetical protein BH11ARM2_BH11ARM2_03050 [soil metagenome]
MPNAHCLSGFKRLYEPHASYVDEEQLFALSKLQKSALRCLQNAHVLLLYFALGRKNGHFAPDHRLQQFHLSRVWHKPPTLPTRQGFREDRKGKPVEVGYNLEVKSVVVIAALLLASVAHAQFNGYLNRRALPLRNTMAECLQDADVQEVLRLNLDQRLLLRALRSVPPTQPPRAGVLREQSPSLLIFSKLDRTFIPIQRARLRQIAVRRIGLFAPLQAEVALDLHLDATQKANLEKMAAEVRDRLSKIFSNQPAPPHAGADSYRRFAFADQQRRWSAYSYYQAVQIRQRGLAGMIASLRPGQRLRWATLAGRPYADRLLHPSATLQAEVWRRLGSAPGENPALNEARMRMRTATERASLDRECLRRAGVAGLLFPETANRLGLAPEVSDRVYLALTNSTMGIGDPPEPESFLLPEQVKLWRTMIAP